MTEVSDALTPRIGWREGSPPSLKPKELVAQPITLVDQKAVDTRIAAVLLIELGGVSPTSTFSSSRVVPLQSLPDRGLNAGFNVQLCTGRKVLKLTVDGNPCDVLPAITSNVRSSLLELGFSMAIEPNHKDIIGFEESIVRDRT